MEMRTEIATAVQFIAEKLIRQQMKELPTYKSTKFQKNLSKRLQQKFRGHWHPRNPLIGNAYRSLQSLNGRVDEMILSSCREAGISVREVQKALPSDFSVWIDPADVSVRLGEDGSVWMVELIASVSHVDKICQSISAGLQPNRRDKASRASSPRAEVSTSKPNTEPTQPTTPLKGPSLTDGAVAENPMSITPYKLAWDTGASPRRGDHRPHVGNLVPPQQPVFTRRPDASTLVDISNSQQQLAPSWVA
eukprot:m.215239 g.215239  ORF g.215239 m.215239 type:complete len:249 (-) comp19087_c0_seq2:140-886(-)